MMRRILFLMLVMGMLGTPASAQIFRENIVYVGGGTGDPLNGDGGSSWFADGSGTMDGKLLVGDGAVGAPGLGFTDDTNTGIYRVGADELAITTNGIARVYVDTVGLSVGTQRQGAAVFQVNVGTDQNFWVSSSSSIVSLQAVNDAASANVPIQFFAAAFSFSGGDSTFGEDLILGNATDPTISVTTAGQDLVFTTASGNIRFDEQLVGFNMSATFPHDITYTDTSTYDPVDMGNAFGIRLINTADGAPSSIDLQAQDGVAGFAVISATVEVNGATDTFLSFGGRNSGNNKAIESMRIVGSTGYVSINVGGLTPAGKLHVDQAGTNDAVPVLVLDQGDIDEVFTNYIGTSAADGSRSLSSGTATTASKVGSIRIEINGVTRWLRFYDTAI